MRLTRIAIGATAAAAVAWMVTPAVSSASTANSAIPHYQHIVEIMMENTSYGTIIGNPNAPQINALADQFGLATNYFGVTHPSEPNYMANLGGSFFGVQDDNQFYCTPALASTDPTCAGTTVNHTVQAPNLADQLTGAGMTWKGYFQSLPPIPPSGVITTGPNANGPYTFKWPSNSVALYASKHNPFVNFTGTQGALANMVPDTQLATDLAAGNLPNFSLIPARAPTASFPPATPTWVIPFARSWRRHSGSRAATPSWSPGMRTTSLTRVSSEPVAVAPTRVAVMLPRS